MDYCWSNNNNYDYPTFGNGLIYSRVGTNVNIDDDDVFIPSDTTEGTAHHFYHPNQNFDNLINCHINGPWKISIVDVGNGNGHNGYLFDWEIKFADGLLIPDGKTIDSAVVLANNGQEDPHFDVNFSDSIIVFNAPMVSQTTIITDTLRLIDPSGCWYDTVFQITVLAPEGTAHHDTICEGESITLTAECTSPETLIFSEGFSDITTGNDNNGSGSSTKYQCNLENFPVCDNEHVFNAGGHLRFGDVSSGGGGYITSKPIDLSNPYTIKLLARGWNNANENPFFYLKVDNDIVLQQSLPVSAWDAPYTQYNYPSPIGANSSSTITIGNSELHQRFFLDSVAVVSYAECQYSWSTGATTSEITDSPSSNTTYYVTITPPGGCATVDTFYVVVKPKPTVTFNPCGGTCDTQSLPMECQNGVTLPAATPCASDYEFAGWSTTPVDPAVTTEPESLYLNGEMFLSSQDITLYAVYMKCTPTGGSKYVKVSSDTSDWTGEYLIAYSEGNKVFDGSRSNLDSVNNFQPVTISNGVIAGSSQPFTFTISPRNNNKYSIKSANNFYIGNDANSNSLSSSTTTQYDNTISYDNGNIDIAGNNGAHLRFNDNNDQKRFRYFKSSTYTSQKAIQLYRNEPEEDCVWWSWPFYPSSSLTESACESYTWHRTDGSDTTITTSGQYLFSHTMDGCLYVDTLKLTINHATQGDTTAVECETFTWHGVTYNETPETAPTYTIVGGNHNGCDSVVTLHLTINHATQGDTTAVECETFTWHGVTYNETPETAPTYTMVGGNHNGCDSVVTLHLTINHATQGDTTAVECETFTWHGVTY
ncbi:MAG: InlB B-repeat-containing protein, partial [Bacteroidales bacterium]|nr:InlB B-repeat-containing protein [Bacteroidales bacterium]